MKLLFYPSVERFASLIKGQSFFLENDLSPDDDVDFEQPSQENFFKAIVSMARRADGKMDWASIPVGDSVFVRIKKAGHPMQGRVVLLTKRPDKQMAVAGGWGSTKVANQSLAMRHLPFNTREASGTHIRHHKAITPEQQKALEERKKILLARAQMEHRMRSQLHDSKKEFIGAMGLNHEMSEEAKQQIFDKAYEQAKKGGVEEEVAKTYAKEVMKESARIEKKLKEDIAKDRASKSYNESKGKESSTDVKDRKDVTHTDLSVSLPDIEKIKEATGKTEIESIVKNSLQENVQQTLDKRTKGTFEHQDKEGIKLVSDVKKESSKDVDHKQRTQALEKFAGVRKAYDQVITKYKKLPKIERLNPARLEEMRLEAEHLTPEEFDSIAKDHENITTQIEDSSFYRMLSKHWNSRNIDKRLVDDMHKSAATAVNGMFGANIKKMIEAERVMKALGIQAGTMVLAYKLKDELNAEDFRDLIHTVEKQNIENVLPTEHKAISEVRELEAQERQIRRQKKNKELSNKATIKKLLIQNISKQRETLASALGSMEASASMLFALKSVYHSKDPVIEVSMGNDRRLLAKRMKMLKLRTVGRRKNADVDFNGQKGFFVKANASAFKRYLSETTIDVHNVKELDKIKNDKSDTARFKVPYFKSHFRDENGKLTKFKFRTEQRNAINLFKKTDGVRVVTDSTGAGKTNMALGFHAHQLGKKAKYRGLTIVPPGQVEQWAEKARRFTTLPITVIPERTSQENRKKLYAENALHRGIVITSHKDASVDHAIIAKKKFHGVAIDEPQQLKSQRSANLSAGGKRLFNLPIKDRLAMTATPANDNVMQLYDLINWANPKKLGQRTSFERSFGAYGKINAQDKNVRSVMLNAIAPYITSGVAQKRGYNIHQNDHSVKRTMEQRQEQKKIEKNAKSFIDDASKAIEQVKGESDAHFRKRRKNARAKASGEVQMMHEDNLKGREDSPLLKKMVENIQSAGQGKKHAIFVNSKKQKSAVLSALQKQGYKKEQFADLTDVHKSQVDTNEHKHRFNNDPDTPFVLLDKSSLQGFDLQGGHHLHAYGTPNDAADYQQLVGRLDRPNRKGDFAVHNYKFSDSPHDFAKWNYIKQTKPFVDIVKPLVKAVLYFSTDNVEMFLKAHIKEYQRKTKTGRTVTVHQHDDKRKKLLEDKKVFWHGSPSGDMRGSHYGLHVGSHEAAKQALEARIGVPAEGEWDGKRKYGETKLAGKKTLKKKDPHGRVETGHNAGSDVPDHDYYPHERKERAKYSDQSEVDLDASPSIVPVRIKGQMSNTPNNPHEDFKANGYMKSALKKGNAKSGYYYSNVGEDAGSISAVVPGKDHLEMVNDLNQGERDKEVYEHSFDEFLKNVQLRRNTFPGGVKRVEVMLMNPDKSSVALGNIDNTESENKGDEFVRMQLEKLHLKNVRQAMSEKKEIPQEVFDFYLEGDSKLRETYGMATFPGEVQKYNAEMDSAPEDQLNSRAFKKWFGDSKVVDDFGNPHVVYHGTDKKFSSFDLKKATQKIIWFTSDKSAVEAGEVGAQGKGHVMDLYASIQNPAGWDEYEKYGLGQLQDMGFDGVILPDSDGQFTGFAFKPTQLKSASKNKGTYDPANKNIFKALFPERVKKLYNDLITARQRTNTNPTPSQIEAGNYKKGTVSIHGFTIAIENPKGSMRSGVDPNGKRWSVRMKNDYGYFKGDNEGADGDKVDVFLGNKFASETVYAVNQVDPKTRKFDEVKVMLFFETKDSALKAYLSNYSDNAIRRVGSVVTFSIDDFKEWMLHHIGEAIEKPIPKKDVSKALEAGIISARDAISRYLSRASEEAIVEPKKEEVIVKALPQPDWDKVFTEVPVIVPAPAPAVDNIAEIKTMIGDMIAKAEADKIEEPKQPPVILVEAPKVDTKVFEEMVNRVIAIEERNEQFTKSLFTDVSTMLNNEIIKKFEETTQLFIAKSTEVKPRPDRYVEIKRLNDDVNGRIIGAVIKELIPE